MSRADELRVRDYLGHILEAIERIKRYVDNMWLSWSGPNGFFQVRFCALVLKS